MKETLELDLKKIAKILIKHIWIIILCAAVTGAAVFVYVVKMVPDSYRAKVTMYINNNNSEGGNVTSANLTVAQKLVNTYVTFIQSDLILEKVIAETGVLRTAAQVRQMVSAEDINNTELFAVWVTSGNPEEAAKIANAIADIAPDEISRIIEGSYAKKVDPAKVPTQPESDRRWIKGALGALLGAFLASAVFICQSLLDSHVKTEEELEKICSIPVLGAIPEFSLSAVEAKKKARR